MRPFSVWTAVVALLGACAVAQQRDDDYDKPYKFSFNVEKHHHRTEEKDTKGLVKGEFGFVTGDGVYHETAYATDERGDFKILGMRSYFVGLPGLDLPDITKGTKPAPQKTAPVPTPAPAPAPLQPLDLSGIMGCSGCTIPVRKPQQPQALQNGPGPSAGFAGINNAFGRPPSGVPSNVYPSGQQGGQFGGQQGGQFGGQQGGQFGGQQQVQQPAYTPTANAPANMQVGGFTAEDMKALLYRFNYTLGFHGHHEVGDRAGLKKGGYHFNGRDGFERAVSYTANEFGFQPNISLRALGADSRAAPRADTEKGAEFGLKGYEFVWFNAPQQRAAAAARTVRTLHGSSAGRRQRL